MKTTNAKYEKRVRRRNRIRSKVSGSVDMPRLSVYKSNRALYAQIIDDDKGVTLASVTTQDLKGKGLVEKAKAAGAELAKRAGEKGIKKVVFDRGGFIYTGRVKALADGAREGGLQF